MSSLLLIGAGGHGRVTADIAEKIGFTSIKFLDDRFPALKQNLGWEVVGDSSAVGEGSFGDAKLFISLGGNAARAAMDAQCGRLPLTSLAHPQSIVSNHAHLDEGCAVMAGAIVNAGAKIGRCVILNTASVVEHDCQLGDYVHISPTACLSGGVSVGERSWFGAGCVVKEGIKIGRDVIVGAGAVVISDVPDGSTVMGVPAKEVAVR